MKITDDQWSKTLCYFNNIYAGYKESINTPGVCISYSLEYVLKPLLTRYENGERSEALFNEMQNVEQGIVR